jgi:NADH dehydrogenase
MKIAITGANSSVGQILLGHLLKLDDVEIVAGIRSDKARATLPQSDRITPSLIDYQDPASLEAAMAGCDTVIHLAGILIEFRGSNYATANVAATQAVSDAASKAGASHILFISVIGASPDSGNAYFRSKGAGEEIVKQSGLKASVIRTPMLLGPGAAGASSLIGAASGDKAKVLGGGNYTMRPLDIDDLSQAIIHLCQNPPESTVLHELVGPEPISYRDLISRTAGKLNREIEIASIPIWTAKLGAAIGSMLKGGGISPTVIDVITLDEKVAHNADGDLGIKLTPLDNTLNKIITADSK